MNILIICWCTILSILKMLLKSKMCAYIEIHIAVTMPLQYNNKGLY